MLFQADASNLKGLQYLPSRLQSTFPFLLESLSHDEFRNIQELDF